MPPATIAAAPSDDADARAPRCEPSSERGEPDAPERLGRDERRDDRDATVEVGLEEEQVGAAEEHARPGASARSSRARRQPARRRSAATSVPASSVAAATVSGLAVGVQRADDVVAHGEAAPRPPSRVERARAAAGAPGGRARARAARRRRRSRGRRRPARRGPARAGTTKAIASANERRRPGRRRGARGADLGDGAREQELRDPGREQPGEEEAPGVAEVVARMAAATSATRERRHEHRRASPRRVLATPPQPERGSPTVIAPKRGGRAEREQDRGHRPAAAPGRTRVAGRGERCAGSARSARRRDTEA